MSKIVVCQLNFITNNIDYNRAKIISNISIHKKNKADLIIFPELALTGYPPKDRIFETRYHDKIEQSVSIIKKNTKNTCVVFGSLRYDIKKNNIYNSAYVLKNQKLIRVYDKILLPNYSVFDEKRYFKSGKALKGFKIGKDTFFVTICEDLWFENIFYKKGEVIKDIFKKYSKKTIINISASPFHYCNQELRKKTISKISKKYNTPIIYANSIGCQTALIFDGNSFVTNNKGKIINTLASCKEDSYSFYHKNLFSSVKKHHAIAYIPAKLKLNTTQIENTIEAISLGINDFFEKQNIAKKCIIGLSGGIDSALCLLLLVHAIGAKNVSAYYLPYTFSSEQSADNAKKLCKALNVQLATIPINNIFSSYTRAVNTHLIDNNFDLTYENLQSRIRGTALMMIANKNKQILINTSNKSELAVGYGTLYGDMMGAISIIGDLYKVQVYQFAEYFKENMNIAALKSIIEMEPSAELNQNQKDTDSLPNYSLLDSMLFEYINNHKSIDDVIKIFKKEHLAKEIYKKIAGAEFKRKQFCPILKVSNASFGNEWRFNIVGM